MKIHQKQKEEAQVFELSGELDFHTSPALRDKLHEVIDKKMGKIVVNLKKVSYIDSSGLATFVEAFQKIKRYSGKLVLAELEPPVRSVFEIAKLDSVFLLAGSEEEAYKLLA
ncbi:MAG TPA: STAS domain-containing protein [bacterium]|nr:STAS domain-containing protein [bacterium]